MHTLQRVIFATVITAGVTLAAASGLAQAQHPSTRSGQGFPAKPIRLVVGYGPGTQVDTTARLIGQKISENWGQAVVLDNRPGASGTLAASMVAKAAPDGHTLLLTGVSFVASAAMQPGLPYDPVKDFAGIAHLGVGTQALLVAPALGVTSVKDLIALAKAQPGKLIFGSAATGTGTHLGGARFNLATGIKVVHVAFKLGQEAMIETMTGRIHYSMVTLLAARPFIKDGKLLALAVTSPQRLAILPEVPALAESVPEFKRPEASSGLLAPAGTPRPILNQISKEVARILDLPDVKERLQFIGYVSSPSTPEEYNQILREQIQTLSRVVRDAGLRSK